MPCMHHLMLSLWTILKEQERKKKKKAKSNGCQVTINKMIQALRELYQLRDVMHLNNYFRLAPKLKGRNQRMSSHQAY